MMKKTFIFLLALVQLSSAFLWVDDDKDANFNCNGTVTDAICCHENLCDGKTEDKCLTNKTMAVYLCKWEDNKCKHFRDDINNVCCTSKVPNGCDALVHGRCPEDWQVPEKCCSGKASKWNKTLVGVKDKYVCCNEPCTEMGKNKCPLPDHCGPTEKSLGFLNPYTINGFHSNLYLANQHKTGTILHGTGFGGDYAMALYDEMGMDQQSDNYQADEVTVDDLMAMLIEALEDDKDVIQYNKEATTDPYLGKTYSGGHLSQFNFPNPDIFLDRIYGSPFGLSQGQIGQFPHLQHNPYQPNYYGTSSYQNGYQMQPQTSSYQNGYQMQPQYYGGYQQQPSYGYYEQQQPNYGYPSGGYENYNMYG